MGEVVRHHRIEQDLAGLEHRRMRLALRHRGAGDGA